MTENHENPAAAAPLDAPSADAEPVEPAPQGDALVDATSAEGLPVVTPPSVMDLLAEHVPLALLADLAAPDGPVSQAILETEGMPEDAWWEGDERPESDTPVDAAGEDELPVDPDAAAG